MHDRAVKIFQVYKNLLILGLLGIPIGLVVGGSMPYLEGYYWRSRISGTDIPCS